MYSNASTRAARGLLISLVRPMQSSACLSEFRFIDRVMRAIGLTPFMAVFGATLQGVIVIGPVFGQTPTPTPVLDVCRGDCTMDAKVQIEDLISVVNTAQRNAALNTCTYWYADANYDGEVTLEDAVVGARTALGGFSPFCTP